jgi:hypothetical protein
VFIFYRREAAFHKGCVAKGGRLASVKRATSAQPFAGGGVPPDHRRKAPEAGGQGETRSGSPTKTKLKLLNAFF